MTLSSRIKSRGSNSNAHKTVICALHSRYYWLYSRWIGCYCFVDSIMQQPISNGMNATSAWKKKTSKTANNNSKIITIKRSAARTHNKNKCIVLGCHVPADEHSQNRKTNKRRECHEKQFRSMDGKSVSHTEQPYSLRLCQPSRRKKNNAKDNFVAYR